MTDPAAGAMPASAPTATLDKKKSIILGVIGLAVIVVIFVKVIPQIGSYSEALAALENMSLPALIGIGLAVVAYLALYGLPFLAATPGLTYWRSQQVNQAAFAISNGVPAGGAFGLGVQYAMLASYNVTPTAATAAITTVGLWSTFVTLGLPILGVIVLVLSGENGSSYVLAGLAGLGILVAAVVVFVLIIRSESLAAGVGRLVNRIVRPLGRWVSALRDLDAVPMILKFRGDIYGLVRSRWYWITLAQLAVAVSQFMILYVAVRGIEGWDSAGTSIGVVFAAYAISQLGLMIPITPGGLGTVDAAMIALMTNFGVPDGVATAADLVWRATSYVPQIVIGVIALVLWYRRAGQYLAERQAAKAQGDPA